MPACCHPDILTMAKPLANVGPFNLVSPLRLPRSLQGVPIGAILMKDKVADMIKIGDHGTTFGSVPPPPPLPHLLTASTAADLSKPA